MNKQLLKQIAKHTLPAPLHRFVGSKLLGENYRPPTGMADLGSLHRLTPLSQIYGFDRGQPIGRYYGENYLAHHALDIRGHVLEIGDANYTRKFGGVRVSKSDVLHIEEGNPEATIIGDLANIPEIPDNTFDCFILYQTLQLIYDLPAAIKTTYRILKPGGVVLVAVPGIIQLADVNWRDFWYWSFTSTSMQRLFQEFFPKENIQVETFGNALSAIAALQGMASEEFKKQELDYCDPNYQVSITVRAVKPNH
ncbi:MAG: methyltransferase domain-containing protein [Scytonematopsis contorta HA4267-MV1]|jgi:SAM-dependent methyltransferase|nr:methyltransferase domain-containing protein [Scytonematopsis contorta HA4267-MV1]